MPTVNGAVASRPAVATRSTPRLLERGAQGDDVRTVQLKLKNLGYYQGALDGDFGPQTQRAVREFQNRNRLQLDGVVGPRTQATLNSSNPVASAVRSDSFERVPAPRRPVVTTTSGGPAELARYGNGRVPASALQSIGNGQMLYGPAADAFTRMRDDAARAGVHFPVTDSYRSYAAQVDVARRKGLYSQGGLAATPGTSKHGWGIAVDLDLDAPAQRWLRQNASRYGFSDNVPREPWHWQYVGG